MIKEIINQNLDRDGHHVMGPSGWFRAHNCPGSVYLQAIAPKRQGNEDANMGTAMHEAIARGADPDDPQAKMKLDACREFLARFDVGEWNHEASVDYRPGRLINPKAEALVYGRVDAWGVCSSDPSTAILVDWKFGGMPPGEDEAAFQLSLYAAMLMDRHESLDTVEAYLFNPTIRTNKELAFYRFDRGDAQTTIKAWKDDLRRATGEDLQLKAGSWCKYCSALGECPVQKGMVKRIQNVRVTRSNAAECYRQASAIRKWCDDIMTQVREFVRSSEEEVPGLRLVSRRGSRSITDVQKLWDVLNAHGVAVEEFLPLVTVSVTKAEALFADVAKRAGAYKTKVDAKAAFDEAVGVVRKKGSETVELV